MQIKRAIEQVPGGMMTVRLLAGAAITTFAPHAAPFFGSSVDHDTAFDIAGTGKADGRSMVEAIHQAAQLAERAI
jgi:4-hydroxy-L-threonine phosphate dehydrogenase PdxA